MPTKSQTGKMVVFGLGILLGAALAVLPAQAQSYPVRPVRMIVPWPPGGGVDITTRTITPKMAEYLGQPVVVENRAGASGMLGTEVAAHAPADGYTLLMAAAGPNAILPNLVPKIPYDTIKDFAAVSQVANTVYVLVVNPSLPVNSIKELVALAKARPGKLTIGSAGTGTPAHLSGELFKVRAGIDIVHVSYKCSAAPVIEVMGGHITMTIETISPLLPHIKSGKLKALGITSAKRSAQIPDVPTIAESGYPDFQVLNWYAVLAPAGTPATAITRLNQEITKILKLPDIRERLIGHGLEVVPTTPEEFDVFRKEDLARWAKIVKDTNAKFE